MIILELQFLLFYQIQIQVVERCELGTGEPWKSNILTSLRMQWLININGTNRNWDKRKADHYQEKRASSEDLIKSHYNVCISKTPTDFKRFKPTKN